MVNIQIGMGNAKVEASGSIEQIITQLMVAVGDIYQAIKQTNGQAEAEKFRVGCMLCMAPDNPMWDPHDGMVVINKK